MHEETLPPGSLDLLARLEKLSHPALSGWTLAGGTGLALRLGHRVSVDLDLFRVDRVDLAHTREAVERAAPCEIVQDEERTLTLVADQTRMSFFIVRDPFVFPAEPYRFLFVADVRDIALMKIAAIAGRGSRRDFVDLYFILREEGATLGDCLALLPRKYGPKRGSMHHVLKSLTYFADAEAEPLPDMLVPFDWEDCKRLFVRQARDVVLPPEG